jgi:hypothetical protein
MPKAAYCSECGENVYLTEDGRCPKGHDPEALSGHYDAPDPPPVDQGPVEGEAPAPVPGTPAQAATAGAGTGKSKLPIVLGITLVVLLLCCGLTMCAAVFYFDDSESGYTEDPRLDEESAAVEELGEALEGGYGDARDDAERMVKHFYPQFRAHEMAEASDPDVSVRYHLVAESEEVPGFYITFFATRIEDLEAEGADDPTVAYVDEEAGVVWLHPETGTSGLAAFAGPSAMVNDGMRNQIMTDFIAAHSEQLFMTEYGMNSNIAITLRGIDEGDLPDWFDDFTTWESSWDNDLQNGVWVESSFESADE